jgi:hypothetical protein
MCNRRIADNPAGHRRMFFKSRHLSCVKECWIVDQYRVSPVSGRGSELHQVLIGLGRFGPILYVYVL